MKKLFMVLALVIATTACNKMEEFDSVSNFVLTGYNESNADSRTAFGTPNTSTIPFLWSSGDYIWLGQTKSDAINADCQIANFTFSGGSPAYSGTGHVFYNLTGNSEYAKVLNIQTADGNLGNDGDFGYATLDKYNSFCLKHKTSYLWFDTTTEDSDMPKLVSITVDADGVNIAGKQTYDFLNGQWNSAVTEGSSTITLNFAEGYSLVSENSGVMAAMVCLPAAVGGKTLTITYTFDDGSTFTETKTPSKNFESGATLRIKTSIAKDDLVKEPVLRVLTFEDNTEKFSPYTFQTSYYDNINAEEITRTYNISKWSNLIPNQDYGDEMIYGIYDNNTWSYGGTAGYYWEDQNNTYLKHEFPAYTGVDWMTGDEVTVKTYQRQGEVLSNSYAPSISYEYGNYDKERYVYATPPTNGTNTFCVHHGYSDFYNPKDKLSGFEFSDGKPRVIDHMYVANTSYVCYQLESGFSFGVSYDGIDSHVQFKVVAYGYDSATDNNPTTCEFFLVKDGVIVKDWTKWDLTSLGAVVRVEFNMVGSPFDLLDRYPDTSLIPGDIDDITGAYGLGAPGYFAYDNIAVQF